MFKQIISNNGGIYKGNIIDGLKNGFGVYNFKDGAVYKGEWEDNKINGYGVYINGLGKIQSGLWKNGKLILKRPYIYNKLNTHKVYKMQNGTDVFPNRTLVNNYRDIVNFMKGSSDFFNQITAAIETATEYNALVKLCNQFVDSGSDKKNFTDFGGVKNKYFKYSLLLDSKTEYLPIYMPNAEYFTNMFDNMLKTTKSHSSERRTQNKNLYTQFLSALKFSVDKNIENIKYL